MLLYDWQMQWNIPKILEIVRWNFNVRYLMRLEMIF